MNRGVKVSYKIIFVTFSVILILSIAFVVVFELIQSRKNRIEIDKKWNRIFHRGVK